MFFLNTSQKLCVISQITNIAFCYRNVLHNSEMGILQLALHGAMAYRSHVLLYEFVQLGAKQSSQNWLKQKKSRHLV